MEAHEREVRVYRTRDGKTPFLDWRSRLRDEQGRQKVDARIARLRMGNFGDARSVGGGVQELKINFGPGYRVYFARDGTSIVILLLGGDKGTQNKDMRTAQAYWAAYKQEKSHADD
jgi:putative addiction module killer protein